MNALPNQAFDTTWEERILSNIARTTSGGTPNRSTKEYFQGTIPWVKSGELDDNFILDTEEKITQQALDNSSAKLFPAGTLLMAMYGATVGKTGILKIDAATNQAVCGIFPDSSIVDTDFLRYHLIHFRPQLLSQRYGGAQPNVSQTIIKNIPVRLPSLDEQRRIAHVLSTVQSAIEQQARLIALTSELKSALLHKLFTEGLGKKTSQVFKTCEVCGERHRADLKHTEIGLVPESWEVFPLGEVMDGTPKNGMYKPLEAYGTGTLILRINDFSNDGDIVTTAENRINADESEINAYSLQEDDIVTNRVNSLSHLGKTALVGALTEPMLFESNMMKYRVDKTKALPSYIMRLLNSPIGKSQIVASAKRAVAQSSINQGSLKAILLPIPKIEVQEEIVNIIDTIVGKIETHARKKMLLEELFHTLLHQLMVAQIRVNENVVDLTGL